MIFEIIQNNSVIFSFVGSVVLWIMGFLFIIKLNNENSKFDSKPYISINPYVVFGAVSHGKLSDIKYIKYIEIGNYGRSAAQNLRIDFYVSKLGDCSTERYQLSYLPAGVTKKYHRPGTSSFILGDEALYFAHISYLFRGKTEHEDVVLIDKDINNRGWDLYELVD